MLQHLFKPKWQSKKAAVRLKALASLSGESDALILLAKTDIDSEVRMCAVQKLQHIPTLASIAIKTDGVIPRAAKKRLSVLAIKKNIDEYALEQAYALIEDVQVHRYVISDLQKTLTVRKYALNYIEDQSLLFELANSDPSKEIQFLAATKITDYSQLKRLEKLTKNNKRLRQLLKEKSNAYQIQKDQLNLLEKLCKELEDLGNNATWKQDKTHFLTIQQQWKNMQGAIPENMQQRYIEAISDFTNKQVLHTAAEAKLQPLREHYHSIIHTLEKVLKTLSGSTSTLTVTELKEVLAYNQQQWDTPLQDIILPQQELANVQRRYHTVQQHLTNNIKPLQQQQHALQLFERILSDAKALLNQQTIQAKQIERLQQRWQKIKLPQTINSIPLRIINAPQQHYKALIKALKCKLQQQQQHIEQYIIQIEQWLNQMEGYIEAEQLSKAIKAYQSATQLLNQHTFPSAPYQRIKNRIQTATPIIKSAQSWRYWGTDQAREQLIQTAHVLSEANDIPPLERAKQLKDLRNKWKQLGKIDPRHQQKQWQDFDALCTKAYAPCQEFYQEESNSRNDNLSKRQKICTALQQLEQTTHWHTVDWKTITKTIHQYRKQWKQAGAVDRSHWQIINQQFNDVMDGLEVHLEEERRINWTQRENLVTQAENLVDKLKKSSEVAENLPRFIEAAKKLQTQWQPTVTQRRNEEQALWNQFRAAIDAVFNQQRDLQYANQSQLKQNLDNKQQILQQLKALLDATNTSINTITLQSQFKQLETQFNNIHSLPKIKTAQSIQNEFNRLKTQFIKYFAIQQQQQQLQQVELLAEKSALCRVLDKDAAVQTAWETSDQLYDKKLEQKITQCFQKTAIKNNAQSLEPLFELILNIEILLGLPSPIAYQNARMKRQVERLSEQMLSVSDSKTDKQQHALAKIIEYYLLCANDVENHEIIDARFSQIEIWIKTSVENAKKC